MAKIHQTSNQDHQEVEAYIVGKTKEKTKYHEEDAKKRHLRLALLIALIILSMAFVLFVLFWPGVLRTVLSVTKETLLQWKDRLSDYILMPESPERPDTTAGMIWLGFLLALDWLLRVIGKALLFVLAWGSPVLVVGGLLFIEFLVIRFCWNKIDDNIVRKPKKQEIQEEVIHNLSSKMARANNDLQANLVAQEALAELSYACQIYTNLEFNQNGKTIKTDFIVVSPTALTVVEASNLSGLIFGDLSEKELVQWQYADGSKNTEQKIPNPVKQVEATAHGLDAYLQDLGIHMQVHRCVLFTSDNVKLHITDHNEIAETCPLFLLNSQDWKNYLYDKQGSKLDHNTLYRVNAALKKQI